MPDEPLDHVLRSPLPWRDDPPHTECGRDPNKVAKTITRQELARRFKKHGRQRTVFTVCMTCFQRSQISSSLEADSDVIAVLHREIDRVGPYGPVHPGDQNPDRQRLENEFAAILALIENHPEEFSDYLSSLRSVISLDTKRKPPTKMRGVVRRHR